MRKLTQTLLFSGLILSSTPTLAGLEEGIAAANQGQFDIAIKEFQYLVDMGFAPGMYELAKMYDGGYGVPKNPRKAAELLQRAVKLGSADAMFALAVLYQDGRGVKLDKQKAVDLFTQAAKKGLPAAQFNLGVMNANGDGVVQDYVKARFWYERAAANNYTLAMYNLALLYYQGLGVQKNVERSYIWNLLAEFNGYAQAAESRQLDEQSLSRSQLERGQRIANEIYHKIQANTYIAGSGFAE
ncbi:protein prenylyltransferase domain-containing protein [Pseudoalteromonas luteoviolacea CPMOR-1]|uniref:Protein prenylyltransferase domain-containing protein n=1 Tax=Pseudoalteromonas luteoviolacea CPMOR-1 TaxID=1365248 RepID=A0A167JHB4_9GAMM|nr:tetratricopeptide repeat protein [Pseudoalteromonas luteoviolacea]KZN61098.1 protein prenylyltransferase domain-containing protein [Pseudoalteromonas luteoviolacea CPMOR-1]